MKKNAFTLVELIATIALLGMLTTITITVSVRKINETKEHARDTMIESIELAAKNYINDYGNEIQEFNNNDNIYITLQTIVEKEYFTESLIDPTTKKSLPLTNEVYVTREESGEIISTYNINQRKNPKLTLIGSYNEYIEEGSEYVEKGVTAISPTKEDVSSNVTITGTVDTTTPNTYKITYELDNEKITRNVIVFSKNISSEEILKASTYIERLYKTNNYQNDELYNPKFTSEGKEYDTGIRYRGENPNNYVYFNCEDKDSNNVNYGEENYNYANSCEVWRMIGVFEVDNGSGKVEKRVKLINTASTFSASWDSSASTVNNGFGINQWGESKYEDGTLYVGADLKKLLNEYYVNKKGANCEYCNARNQSTCSNTCDEESLKSSNMKVLTVIAKEMIEQVVWKTGALVNMNEKPILTVYQNERESINGKVCVGTTYDNGIYCTDNVERTTKWSGLIGLIYPSDYGYASTNEECYNDIFGADSTCEISNWLHPSGYYWTITSLSSASISYATTYVHSTYKLYTYDGHSSGVVRPSLYLKSSVKIKGGNGSSDTPYILAI